jgi:uncharacterized membrane protein
MLVVSGSDCLKYGPGTRQAWSAVQHGFVPCIVNPFRTMDYPVVMTAQVPARLRGWLTNWLGATLGTKLEGLVWVLFAAHLIAQPIYSLLPSDLEMPGTLFIVATSTAFAFLHLLVSRGPAVALGLLGLCFTVAGSLEMLSVQTGFPYGWYSYSSKLGPGLAGVPFLVPLCWQMMAWNAWRVAGLIVPPMKSGSSFSREFKTIIVAAFALTAWDVFLDPQMVRAGLWTWARHGEYVGIPLENYAGWLFTAIILFAGFSRLNRAANASKNATHARLSWFATLPVLSYVWTWFGSSIVNIFWWGQPLVGVAGLIAMGVFAVPALRVLITSGLIPNTVSGLNSRFNSGLDSRQP